MHKLRAQTPRTSSAQTLRTNLVHKLQTHSKNLETQTIDLLGPSNCHRDPTRSVQVRKSPRPPNPCKCGNTCILIEPFKLLVRRLVRQLVRLLVRACLCAGLCGGLCGGLCRRLVREAENPHKICTKSAQTPHKAQPSGAQRNLTELNGTAVLELSGTQRNSKRYQWWC